MPEIVMGKIVDAYPGGITVKAPYSDWQRFCRCQYEDAEIILTDGRMLSAKQQRAIHATVHDIAEWQSGFVHRERVFNETLNSLGLTWIYETTDDEAVRYQITQRFCELLDIPLFSLSQKSENCLDMSTASEFLGWLIDKCVEGGIPTNGPLVDRAEDTGRYLYSCLANKRCAICGVAGGPADLHHVDRVGMGRNRTEVNHLGLEAESLCRLHHQEVDQIGQEAFDAKYHIFGIPLDENLCKIHGLKYCPSEGQHELQERVVGVTRLP